jgi:hypothetical protein
MARTVDVEITTRSEDPVRALLTFFSLTFTLTWLAWFAAARSCAGHDVERRSAR